MKYSVIIIFLTTLLWSCTDDKNSLMITVTNPLNEDRKVETVTIPVEKLKTILSDGLELEDILVQSEGQSSIVRQLIDNDLDGQIDELLFQVQLDANQEKSFKLVCSADGNEKQPKSEWSTYSRIVPERTDDYTWENDKVAFRTFGMEAQRLVEENEAGGTLSSGIDLWLKRVNYSIIDDWYKKNTDSIGYYHKDHGEGYDPYHVGKSRGAGGIGVWVDDTLVTSKNFIAYRTIAEGPIRTVFELDYAPWSKFQIKETKRISLDLGSNFSKFEMTFEADERPPNYTIGITLHEGIGETSSNESDGWFRHWEPMDDSYLGEGIVVDPKIVEASFVHNSEVRDQSQLFVVTKPQARLTYYAGFGWVKSKQVKDVEDWDKQLELQSKCLQNPLQIKIH